MALKLQIQPEKMIKITNKDMVCETGYGEYRHVVVTHCQHQRERETARPQ